MKKFDLYIDKYGVKLSVKEGQFYIHHKESKQTVPVTKVRTITLSKSTSITGAAIKLALDNDIDVAFVEHNGMPFGRVWNSEFGSIATIRRNQLSFSASEDGSKWIRTIIEIKIKNQMALLANLAMDRDSESPYYLKVKEKFSMYLLKLNETNTKDALVLANQLRGWEANASKLFFKLISSSMPEDFKFQGRSKRPARDPFNATLNYCYGILYNKIESLCIRSGLDPHIGIFHKDQHNRPVLVFDLIEVFRHWAEYPVIEAFRKKLLKKEYFDIQESGVNMASSGKKIIIELLFSYWNDKVKWQGNRAKRITHIKDYIQAFASSMKNYQTNEVKKSGI